MRGGPFPGPQSPAPRVPNPVRYDANVDLIHYPGGVWPGHWQAPVLAIGNFDGVHVGHQAILASVRRSAAARGAAPVALTFDPAPTRVLRPDRAPRSLMTTAQKLEAFEAAGMQGVVVVRFTPELSRWEPERFVSDVLVRWLGVGEVWVGRDFVFGRGRSGTFEVLRELGTSWGFEARKVDPVCLGGAPVSSTRIRTLVGSGAMREAAALLGRPYAIDGLVVRGDARGRQLGFPTANLQTANELVPPNGVYAGFVRRDDSSYPAVANLGTRPTFHGQGAASIEAHLLDVDMDLYGASLRLCFVQRLRDERRFESAEALTRQIREDCRQARAVLDGVSV